MITLVIVKLTYIMTLFCTQQLKITVWKSTTNLKILQNNIL